MELDRERLIRIISVRSFAEAQLIDARLQEQNLPFLMRPFNDPGFGSFWRTDEAWGEVLSYPEFSDQIREICR